MFLSHWRGICLLILRKAHTQSAVEHNYYKILGISPSASQAEIKSAYFELSKKHHPDRNQGSEESAKIFRLVKTAYEVLGSENKRMQYDKERIFRVVKKPVRTYHNDNNPDYKDDAERIHYQSRVRQPFQKFTGGRTTFYDFDAWYDGHFGKNSFEMSDSREPRRFRSYSWSVVLDSKHNVLTKLKHILTAAFYVILALSGLKFSKKEKKRNQ